MKVKAFVYLIVSLCCLSLVNNIWAAQPKPKRMRCRLVVGHPNVTQCIYRVVGQATYNPRSRSNLYAVTNMPYALCSKSLCTIDKQNPNRSICTCPVYGNQPTAGTWQAASVGPKPFRKSHPRMKQGKLVYVTSTFSMANITDFATLSPGICKFDQPEKWADCFGVRCSVDYLRKNGKEVAVATCSCPVKVTKTFTSMGVTNIGQCKTPPNQVWSAATPSQGNNNNAVMRGGVYKKYFPRSPAAR